MVARSLTSASNWFPVTSGYSNSLCPKAQISGSPSPMITESHPGGKRTRFYFLLNSNRAPTNQHGSMSFTVRTPVDRKSTRLNSSHSQISYAVFCLKKKKKQKHI